MRAADRVVRELVAIGTVNAHGSPGVARGCPTGGSPRDIQRRGLSRPMPHSLDRGAKNGPPGARPASCCAYSSSGGWAQAVYERWRMWFASTCGIAGLECFTLSCGCGFACGAVAPGGVPHRPTPPAPMRDPCSVGSRVASCACISSPGIAHGRNDLLFELRCAVPANAQRTECFR